MAKLKIMDKVKRNLAEKLAHEYYASKHPELKASDSKDANGKGSDKKPKPNQPAADAANTKSRESKKLKAEESKPKNSKLKDPKPKDSTPKESIVGAKVQGPATYKYEFSSGAVVQAATPLTQAPEPDEQEVFQAIYDSLLDVKTGKGDKLTDWNWKDPPQENGLDEKTRDAGKGVSQEAGEELLKEGLKTGAEKIGKTIAEKTAETVADVTVNLLARDVEGVVLVFVPGGEIIGLCMLAWDLGEFLGALASPQPNEQAAKEARIFADVKAYFQGKEMEAPGYWKNQIREPSDKASHYSY